MKKKPLVDLEVDKAGLPKLPDPSNMPLAGLLTVARSYLAKHYREYSINQ